MVPISRTMGPIHFEDLEPKRFESLVRALIYDLRDWNKVQSTGIAGSDEGFDIRAWEKKYIPTPSSDEESDDASVIPVDGNLWMIQCKRESDIGPTKVGEIIDENIPDKSSAPHGYILVAPTNFSKKSYDIFAKKLREKGILEFQLWGKPDLESMLIQPKFDRVLFSFFGVSLVAKAKSKTSKTKTLISIKNKLRNILGDTDPKDKHRSILIKDINADFYPWKQEYPDFEKNPKWLEVVPKEYHPTGLIVQYQEHFGYIDEKNKTWDCIENIDSLPKESEMHYYHKPDKNKELTRDLWEHLPRKNRAMIFIQGFIRFKDVLAIDDKGDIAFNFPHIYVDRNIYNDLFKITWAVAEKGDYDQRTSIDLRQEKYKRKSFFPKELPAITKGKFHKDKSVEIDPDLLRIFAYNRQHCDLIAADGRYDYLSVRDIVEYPHLRDEGTSSSEYVKILHKYSTTVAEYLSDSSADEIKKTVLEKQVGKDVDGKIKINVLEFEKAYYTPVPDVDKST